MTNAAVHQVVVQAEQYADSVRLMAARRAMREVEGTATAEAVMGTAANRDELLAAGFDAGDLDAVGANDLVLAVAADGDDTAQQALSAGEAALGGDDPGRDGPSAADDRQPRTLEQAVQELPDANVALVSVAGEYALLEAHKALSAGLHVLLFSSGISVDDELELKRRAGELGLLVMGPDAGTAMLGGVGLGFANVVAAGPVGVVAAAGTGAQEVMTLLHRWGAGPSHVIGVGGRDTSERIDGAAMRMGLAALRADPDTEALLIVSKPPARQVAESLLSELEGVTAAAAFVGLDADEVSAPEGVLLVSSLERAALAILEALDRTPPDPAAGMAEVASRTIAAVGERRGSLRGLFSGGTLCYEAMVLASRHLGPVHSNTPLHDDWGLPVPDGAHQCLDLGAEEYTQGRPHPMIDPEPRAEALREHGGDPKTAVVLFDVVLGHGAHENPAAVLAPACAEITEGADAPAVVAYVLGTDGDPQGLAGQREQLEEAGCVLAPTNARAALLAAAITSRDAVLAEAPA